MCMICMYIHVCMHTCMCVFIIYMICMYVCMYTCMIGMICMYVYVCTYLRRHSQVVLLIYVSSLTPVDLFVTFMCNGTWARLTTHLLSYVYASIHTYNYDIVSNLESLICSYAIWYACMYVCMCINALIHIVWFVAMPFDRQAHQRVDTHTHHIYMHTYMHVYRLYQSLTCPYI